MKLKKMLLGVLAIPCLILTACGVGDIAGKIFEYDSSVVEFSGTGTANQTALETEKQNLKTTYENVTMHFGENGKVNFDGTELFYILDGRYITLYNDNAKKEKYEGFKGSDVKIKTDGEKVTITYKGNSDNDNEDYCYKIILKTSSDPVEE